ncbi:DUF5796 family protein [Natrarchaeobaculum sulfurireducens]|uniref:Uncharacterized protein n=1 Tax=Natrarchaeobaculum sulfurireducens TaxID=2044521 RepID=A0A346PDD7_9EURY|nr:DUF5796 family protein [Natrarchaeobaculum sulfurireducens]AXR77532.1 hypothetical protein AArc1_1192 [Natrarchaeobaculum sulfurireducens]AXR82525.1 hypothetical protein AArcMg_2534 [Natrarchaeobaculum sulfurireducens]
MSIRSNVAPSTLGVDFVEGGVVVQYLDGRETFYHGPPKPVEESLRTPPGKHVHVLVTDSDGVEGVMTYVNDRDTHDGILEKTGVGRMLLEADDEEELFPGVTVTSEAYSVRVEADLEVVDGRVFVFAEDEMSEHAYELVGPDYDGSARRDVGDDSTTASEG